MRWERLFADLEAQLESVERAELESEVADRTRRELARVRLTDRLAGALHRQVTCHVVGTGPVHGSVSAVGPDWVLLDEGAMRQALLPLGTVTGITGLGARARAPGSEGAVARRLGLSHALRALARDRSAVALGLVDATTVTGTIDGVGADFVDLAQHGAGEDRRAGRVAGVRTVPHAALASVRRA